MNRYIVEEEQMLMFDIRKARRRKSMLNDKIKAGIFFLAFCTMGIGYIFSESPNESLVNEDMRGVLGETWYCPNCGYEIYEIFDHCPLCGYRR